jgi:hypothetical protein
MAESEEMRVTELTEEELRGKAEVFANELVALLNQARDDGLMVSLDTNEYDCHSVGYPITAKGPSVWIHVVRGDHGSGPYEVERGRT